MPSIRIDRRPTPEIVVHVTWRRWEDGRWEAWLVDESGLPPHKAEDRKELERFLEEAWQRAAARDASGEDHEPR